MGRVNQVAHYRLKEPKAKLQLNWLWDGSTDSSIEDWVTLLENIISQTIDTYQTLDFYESHKEWHTN